MLSQATSKRRMFNVLTTAIRKCETTDNHPVLSIVQIQTNTVQNRSKGPSRHTLPSATLSREILRENIACNFPTQNSLQKRVQYMPRESD